MTAAERFGVGLLGVGLLAFATAALLAQRGLLDDLVVAVVGVETLRMLGVVLGGLVVVAAVQAAKTRGGRAATGRMVSGHAHGPNPTIARHEAGHAAAARALGGQVHSATADRRGGYVHATIPNSPRAAITFWLAGRRAAGTGAGCSADDALIRAELRTVPRSERGQVRRDADRDARRIVNQHRGQIRRDARTLERTGTL